jgi:formylglycine-generating enzyme required for sulfatase activity
MRQSSAAAWCVAHGGTLPTEEQWETAARGLDLKPHPWGAAAPTESINAQPFSPSPALLPVDAPTNDKTPYNTPILNLAGNAREWTSSDWRTPDGMAPRPQPGMPFTKVVRGLPLLGDDADPANNSAAHSATWRSFRCSGFNCTGGRWFERRDDVGFRCAKPPPCMP